MHTKDMKALLGRHARRHGFSLSHGAWHKHSLESFAVLELQKSNFGNCFWLHIKVFVQGVFGKQYSTVSKEMVKKLTGNVFFGQPKEFDAAMDFDTQMESGLRDREIGRTFEEFVVPMTAAALSRAGLLTLASQERIYLLPAVRKELEAVS